MRCLARRVVDDGRTKRTIELCVGDLSRLTPADGVDLLVVSAFRNDYTPTPNSLIGALHAQGVSVEQLARSKERDERDTSCCWLSSRVRDPGAGIHFDRVVGFEPRPQATRAEVIGDLFRALYPFVGIEYPEATVAMPIVGTGDMGWSRDVVLEQLVDEATLRLQRGLPVKRLLIVGRDAGALEPLAPLVESVPPPLEPAPIEIPRTPELLGAPALEPERGDSDPLELPVGGEVRVRAEIGTRTPSSDLFISYAHEDDTSAVTFHAAFQQLRPDANVFFDRSSLAPGSDWLRELYAALDGTRCVACLLSPDYVTSRFCQEEFMAGRLRDLNDDGCRIFPVYVRAVDRLPVQYRLTQYVDCCESDATKLRAAAATLAGQLG